ncbi:hypothetical protein EHI8A_027000 [Entamoeba histolytica HM-1:IMSS-B]|uniref:RAVE complex protein Rav1 C-terminal domain-containing protein n=4 Tax=Entamoeba histolytica TaxID=5759 RepID=C4M8U0_ENTH1|nr:hypothetical protein, conserved [Entamoeba histolytica HM-1:IMSS]EAL45040.1 hypothetical protein, conserved [Entamoeba histolytica HM-1:IMSS]EMH77307.1 hypothetical protein EHI8A_027000 [Entamoeba histolytica HM-1:IMSS-B]ENY61011.1 hypothetical protein EHI7A_029780 [Entamoeba histolytica HM-1:IMSS-A]GAT98038.1 hypothetical protein conserved [Entamoeba histolytica]|eukprot:XP_650426.1 hypothetical protein, conserved [Entamoeba histolytica HM-1:IMSS]
MKEIKHLNPSYINSGMINDTAKWKWGEYKQFHMIAYINDNSILIVNADNLRVFQELVFDSPPISFSFSPKGTLIVSTKDVVIIYHPENTRTLFQPPSYQEYSRQNIQVDSVNFLNIENEENKEYFIAIGIFLQIYEIKKRESDQIFSIPIVHQKHLSTCIDGIHFTTWGDKNFVKVWRYIRETNKVVVQYIKTNGKVKYATWRRNWTQGSPALLIICDEQSTTLWYDNPSSIQSESFSLLCFTGLYIPASDGLVSWIYYHHKLHNPYFPIPKPSESTSLSGFHSASLCQRLLPKIDIPRQFSPDYLIQFDGTKIIIITVSFTPQGTPIIDFSEPVVLPDNYYKTFNFNKINSFIPMCTESLRGCAKPTKISLCCRAEGKYSLFSLKKEDDELPKTFKEPSPLVIAGHTAPIETIIVHQTQQYFLSISKNETILWLIGGVQQYLGAYLKLIGILKPYKKYCFIQNYIIGVNGKDGIVYQINQTDTPEEVDNFTIPFESTCICCIQNIICIGSQQGILMYSYNGKMLMKGTIRVKGVININGNEGGIIFIGTNEGNYYSKIDKPVAIPLPIEGKIYSHSQLRICVINNCKISIYQKEASEHYELEATLGDSSNDIVICQQRSGYIDVSIGKKNVLEWWVPSTIANIRTYNSGYELLDSIQFSEKIGAIGITKEGTTIVAIGKKILIYSKWEQNIQRIIQCIEPQQSYSLYHPRCLLQLLFAGSFKQVEIILSVYLEIMKKSQPFPLIYDDVYEIYNSNDSYQKEPQKLYSEIIELLQQMRDTSITTSEQACIAAICEALKIINSMEGLDECGKNYFISFKLDCLLNKICGRIMTPIDFIWAYHSEAKESLKRELEIIQVDLNGAIERGIGYWMLNKPELLKDMLSNIAKIEYMKKKDPNDVAIIYILLGRIPALAALYRLNKEMKINDFLMKDFNNERNKIAAIKNAYVLNSQHKYILSIAFFLIGGAITEAIQISFDKLNNIGLGFIIAKICSSDFETTLRNVLLPEVIKRNDIVGQFFCYIQLKEYQNAIKSLILMKEEPTLFYLLEYFKSDGLLKQMYGVNEIEHSSFNFMRRNIHLYLRNRCSPLAYHFLDAQFDHTSCLSNSTVSTKNVSISNTSNDDWFDDFMSNSAPIVEEKKKEISINQCFPKLIGDLDISSMKIIAQTIAEHLIHRFVLLSKSFEKDPILQNFVVNRIVPFLNNFGIEKESVITTFYDICTLTDSIDVLCISSCLNEQEVKINNSLQDSPFVSSFVDQGMNYSIPKKPQNDDIKIPIPIKQRSIISPNTLLSPEPKTPLVKKQVLPKLSNSISPKMATSNCLGMQFIKKAEEPLYLYLISRVFPPVHSLNALSHLYSEAHHVFVTHLNKQLQIPKEFVSLMVILIFVVSGRIKNYDLVFKLISTKDRTLNSVCSILKECINDEQEENQEMSDSEQFVTGLLMLFTIPLLSELLKEVGCVKTDLMLKKWKESLVSYTSYLTPTKLLEEAPTEFSFRIFSKQAIEYAENACQDNKSMKMLYNYFKNNRADVVRNTMNSVFNSTSLPSYVKEVEPQINVPQSKNTLMIDTPPVYSYCCSYDNNFVIYSTKDGIKRLAKFKGVHNDIQFCFYGMHPQTKKAVKVTQFIGNCMDANPNHPYFVVGTEDGLILIFKYSQDEAIQQTAIHNNISPSLNGNGPKGFGIKSVKWNNAGTKFIVSDAMGYVAVYRFTVNEITMIFSERIFIHGVDACFIGESMFFVAAGNNGVKGEVVIGNLLESNTVVTRTVVGVVNAMCLVQRFGSVIISDNDGIKFVDLQTGRVFNQKKYEKGVCAVAVDTYSLVLFVGLCDGRILMSHLPDLEQNEEIGKHENTPRGGKLFKLLTSSNYHAVNKLGVVWFDKNSQPELYSCSSDGSLIQRSLIYFQ